MKGDFTLKILEIIVGVVGGAGDVVEAFLRAGYGASYSRYNRVLGQLHDERAMEDAKRIETQRVQSMIYKLKKSGLVKTEDRGGKHLTLLTIRGKEKLNKLRAQNNTRLPASTYPHEAHARFTIVTFDIAERDRRKRGWLRDVLKNLTFTMLQKSVWIGKVKIPETLLEDLRKLRLLGPVEIFEISKGGTLRQVT